MAEHFVGLDIGSFAVRAAEVSGDPGSLTLHRFAQLTLPPGAVVDGEIIDSVAVTAAIKSLWDKGDFKSKKVTVGIANKWVKVRQAEVPALAPDEVRTSLRYEAQDVIPFAAEDSVVDFVVQDRYSGPEGGEMLRILVVAAQRQMVSTTLEAVRKAGLTPTMVDLTPFALVRALAPVTAPGTSEAIVSIGAGLTNVVVHTAGTPRLVRMTARAGALVTQNLSKALGVDSDRAEALKRGAGVAVADPQTAQAADLIANELAPLVQEIQGSLDYFLAQAEDVDLKRVLLTGAGSKMAGLRARLESELRLPVEMASPLEYLNLGRTNLTDEQLEASAAVLAAPVGLAMAAMASPSTKLTTLFPAEYNKSAAEARQRMLVGAAVAVLALGLGGGFVARQTQVISARTGAEQATVRSNELDKQVATLAPLETLKAQIDGKYAEAQAALASDVDMTRMLDTVTAALPTDIGLNSVNISVTPSTATATPATPGAAAAGMGTFTVAGNGLSHDSVARWITNMRQLNIILSDVWVSSSTVQSDAAGTKASFSGTATIPVTAKSDRAAQLKPEVDSK